MTYWGMARSAARIQLSTEEEATLRQWLRQGTSEQRQVERARVILLSHEGLTVEKVAERLSTRPARVSKWRQRFAQNRLAGLSDAPRSGKPNKYTEATEKRVLKMLDETPPKGFSQWNGKLLAQALGRRRHGQQLGDAVGEQGLISRPELDSAREHEALYRTTPIGQILAARLGIEDQHSINSTRHTKSGIPMIHLKANIAPE